MVKTCREAESWKCVTCWQESGITLSDGPQTKNTTSHVETTVIKPLKATKATKSIRRRPLCEHGQQRHLCKDCGGASICEHGRRRHVCKDCGGKGICPHGRQRCRCKDCGGTDGAVVTTTLAQVRVHCLLITVGCIGLRLSVADDAVVRCHEHKCESIAYYTGVHRATTRGCRKMNITTMHGCWAAMDVSFGCVGLTN